MRLKWMTIFMVVASLLSIPAHAYEINDKVSIGGVLAGAYQYQDMDEPPGLNNEGRGAMPFQPELSFRPTSKDEISVKLGFAEGNALNLVSPFILRPWAAALEEDVKNINGRDRDYLLTAWYKHTFHIADDHRLGLTGGLIDATQFMNEALVNGPNAFLPSYDYGGALEWEVGHFSLKGVFMAIGSNADGNAVQFYGGQIGYKVMTPLGEGNYRLIGAASSDDFLDPEGKELEARRAVLLSCDQKFGEVFGGWLRIGEQADRAAINFKRIYSGGLNITGKLWGREKDNIGIGYGFLEGGNTGVEDTQVAEVYARFLLTSFLALSLDVQYMRDEFLNRDTTKGFIYGLRLIAEF
jgi:porin